MSIWDFCANAIRRGQTVVNGENTQGVCVREGKVLSGRLPWVQGRGCTTEQGLVLGLWDAGMGGASGDEGCRQAPKEGAASRCHKGRGERGWD